MYALLAVLYVTDLADAFQHAPRDEMLNHSITQSLNHAPRDEMLNHSFLMC
jgi:hypothetical protein